MRRAFCMAVHTRRKDASRASTVWPNATTGAHARQPDFVSQAGPGPSSRTHRPAVVQRATSRHARCSDIPPLCVYRWLKMRKLLLQEVSTLDGLAAGANDSLDLVPAATQGDRSFGEEQLRL